MNLTKTVLTAAALLGGAMALPLQANAVPLDSGLKAPPAAENVACRVTRARVIGPGGRVTFRTSRVCDARASFVRPGCTTVRERIARPNGAVVFKTVRRCN